MCFFLFYFYFYFIFFIRDLFSVLDLWSPLSFFILFLFLFLFIFLYFYLCFYFYFYFYFYFLIIFWILAAFLFQTGDSILVLYRMTTRAHLLSSLISFIYCGHEVWVGTGSIPSFAFRLALYHFLDLSFRNSYSRWDIESMSSPSVRSLNKPGCVVLVVKV
jgi:hypothetical protein